MDARSDQESRAPVRPLPAAATAILAWGTWLLVCGLAYAQYIRLADWQGHGHLHVSVFGSVLYWGTALVVMPRVYYSRRLASPLNVLIVAAMMLGIYTTLVSSLF